MTPWRWWRDWRERRSTLNELKDLQQEDEWKQRGDTLNPLHLAKTAMERGEAETSWARWQEARIRMPNFIYQSEDSLPILIGLTRWDEAESFMEEIRRRSPRDRRWRTGLARIAEARGDYAEAARRWKAAQGGGTPSVEAWIHEANCLMRIGRLDEAEAAYDSMLRKLPGDLTALVERAKISGERGDWEKSLTRWQAIAERDNSSYVYAGHAKALIGLGRYDEAESILAQAVLIYPADLAIGIARSQLAERKGDLVTACERWTELQHYAPGSRQVISGRVQCLFKLERHAEADTVIAAAVERFPNESWPSFDYATLAHFRRDWPKAIARWESFRLRFPDLDEGYSWGANALDEAGRREEATALRQEKQPG